MAISEAGRAG